MGKYRKKPVVIEAWQVAHEGAALFVDAPSVPGIKIRLSSVAERPEAATGYEVYDALHDTWVKFDRGDWIIKGVKGEYYPCKPDIFDATYEPMEEKRRG